MTDCALVNPPSVQGNNWFRGDSPLVPLPKPWPSAEARERVVDLGAHKHGSPQPSSYGALIRKAMAGCKCLVDCDQIAANRVKMMILPLLIKKRRRLTLPLHRGGGMTEQWLVVVAIVTRGVSRERFERLDCG